MIVRNKKFFKLFLYPTFGLEASVLNANFGKTLTLIGRGYKLDPETRQRIISNFSIKNYVDASVKTAVIYSILFDVEGV